jgi:phospholipid/cholesterol/gamma-HCH transport system substrate-binding protein
MNQRAIEIRVGALILVAVTLVGAFVAVVGGLSLQPTITVNVSFQNPGGLVAGAPVRISGVKVGKVSDIEFVGGLDNRPAQQPDALIRAVAKIEKRYAGAIHDDARWFVTAQGVLGEMFLAVDPGTRSRPVIQDGAVVRGVSPPQLDLLLSEGYELLHRAYRGLTDNEKQIAETFAALHRTLNLTGDLLERNGPKLDRLADNAESISNDAKATLAAARERYVDGPQITRILNNVERSSQAVSQNVEPLLGDSRAVLSDAKKITRALAGDEQLARIDAMTRDASQAAASAKNASSEAEALVGRVKRGQGTAGQLLADEALYDDLSELVRDLKHNPWKLLWKN